MNRRSFLSAMLKGAAAFTILPGAGRLWKAERWLPNNPDGVILCERQPTIIPWSAADVSRFNSHLYDLLKKQASPEHVKAYEAHKKKLLAQQAKFAKQYQRNQRTSIEISGIIVQL